MLRDINTVPQCADTNTAPLATKNISIIIASASNDGYSRKIDVTISKLRKKIGDI